MKYSKPGAAIIAILDNQGDLYYLQLKILKPAKNVDFALPTSTFHSHDYLSRLYPWPSSLEYPIQRPSVPVAPNGPESDLQRWIDPMTFPHPA